MKQRVGWIDIAKGICMIAVILGHMGFEQLGFVYSFHLTTFFILSGYTLKKADLTLDYLKQKFSRLMVPYFVTCAAVVLMGVVNALVIGRDFTILNITGILYRGIVKTFFASGGVLNFGSITVGRGIGAIWFLPAMFFAILLVQLILRLKSKYVMAAVAVAMFALSAITATVIWLPFSILAAMFSVPFILFGKWIKEYDVLEKIKWWHYIILFAIFVVGCHFDLAQVFYMVNCAAKDWLLTPLFAVCSSLCVIGLSRLIKRFAPLEFIGKNSLIFLCVHLFQINTLPTYFAKARDLLHIPHTFWPRFIMEMLFAILVSGAIVWLSSRKKENPVTLTNTRDRGIDIMRAALIILMIVGHTTIDGGLSRFIYSFHMMAFVMVSGYFYNAGHSVRTNITKALKTLLPYVAFCVLYFFVAKSSFLNGLRNLICGMSFTKHILSNVPSVGPVYFILMLCAVKIVYTLVSCIRNEFLKNAVIALLFCGGILAGRYGIWLPWTFDGALVSLLFYHIAHYFRKYDVLKKCAAVPAIYFPLSCIWAFLIYKGGMELSMRNYGNIGLTVIGAISAFVVSYLLCRYLADKLPQWLAGLCGMIGQCTAHILVLHTLFGNKISDFVANTLQLNPANIFHLVVNIVIQIALSILSFILIREIKKLFAMLYRAKVKQA